MNCDKCQDRGFTEENHGLIIKLCNCGQARGVAEKYGIPWIVMDTKINLDKPIDEEVVRINVNSDSGTGQDNSNLGSADTSQLKQPKKHKAKKTARKGTG